MIWNDSNLNFGLTAVRNRPPGIPIRSDACFACLASHASERMRVTRHGLDDRTPPNELKRRLCAWWGSVSREILILRMGDDVNNVLAGLAPFEFEAAGIWLDGKYHHNGITMARILWHLQCADSLVSAALDLHRRISRRTTRDEERSRDAHSGQSTVGLIQMIGML